MRKITTADGSTTYYSKMFDEHYHSLYGAKNESNLVYINALREVVEETKKNEICIFEMGFGSGLNALLAFEFAQKNQISLYYFSVEKYPIEVDILLQESNSTLYQEIINSQWNTETEIEHGLFLLKIETDILQFNFEAYKRPDVVFYDAFSCEKQPELWTEEIFSRIFKTLNNQGILATYSSKGIVKEALRKVGFFVKRLPGPMGKRHILNVIKM